MLSENTPVILGLETSGPLCSVGVSTPDGIVLVCEEEGARIHGERITLLIQQVMSEAGVHMEQVQAVAVSSGPGSFTGLRVGMSTAKGLCMALSIPLITCSTLECLGREALTRHGLHCVIGVIEARKGEYFTAEIGRMLTGISGVQTAAELEAAVGAIPTPVNWTGPGLSALREEVDLPGVFFPQALSARPVVLEGLRQFAAGNFASLLQAEPVYGKGVRITSPGKS